MASNSGRKSGSSGRSGPRKRVVLGAEDTVRVRYNSGQAAGRRRAPNDVREGRRAGPSEATGGALARIASRSTGLGCQEGGARAQATNHPLASRRPGNSRGRRRRTACMGRTRRDARAHVRGRQHPDRWWSASRQGRDTRDRRDTHRHCAALAARIGDREPTRAQRHGSKTAQVSRDYPSTVVIEIQERTASRSG